MYMHVLFLSLLLSFSRSLSLSPSLVYMHICACIHTVLLCTHVSIATLGIVLMLAVSCMDAIWRRKCMLDLAVSMATALRLVVLALKIIVSMWPRMAVAVYAYVHTGACSVLSGFLALASGPLLCFGPSFGHTLAP